MYKLCNSEVLKIHWSRHYWLLILKNHYIKMNLSLVQEVKSNRFEELLFRIPRLLIFKKSKKINRKGLAELIEGCVWIDSGIKYLYKKEVDSRKIASLQNRMFESRQRYRPTTFKIIFDKYRALKSWRYHGNLSLTQPVPMMTTFSSI